MLPALISWFCVFLYTRFALAILWVLMPHNAVLKWLLLLIYRLPSWLLIGLIYRHLVRSRIWGLGKVFLTNSFNLYPFLHITFLYMPKYFFQPFLSNLIKAFLYCSSNVSLVGWVNLLLISSKIFSASFFVISPKYTHKAKILLCVRVMNLSSHLNKVLLL